MKTKNVTFLGCMPIHEYGTLLNRRLALRVHIAKGEDSQGLGLAKEEKTEWNHQFPSISFLFHLQQLIYF